MAEDEGYQPIDPAIFEEHEIWQYSAYCADHHEALLLSFHGHLRPWAERAILDADLTKVMTNFDRRHENCPPMRRRFFKREATDASTP